VEPCSGGWLLFGAKLQGITIAPQPPEVFGRFIDILDYRPSYAVLAVHLPLGLPSLPVPGGRTCDRDARRLLGQPRGSAIASPPSWKTLQDWRQGIRGRSGISVPTRSLFPRIAEVYEHLSSYHQRTVFEVHPELSFYELNNRRSLSFSKHTQAGQRERMDLLAAKVPGVERHLDLVVPGALMHHLLDAAADLWTARRIKARGVSRLPEDPEWDEQGFRMEYQR
jgi:predicted RNase H-like nuclease